MPSTHTDAMRLQAENLVEAVHSNVASKVTSRINSIAPSLIASAIQSRRGSINSLSIYQSCLGSSSTSRRGSLGPSAASMKLPPGKKLEYLLNKLLQFLKTSSAEVLIKLEPACHCHAICT